MEKKSSSCQAPSVLFRSLLSAENNQAPTPKSISPPIPASPTICDSLTNYLCTASLKTASNNVRRIFDEVIGAVKAQIGQMSKEYEEQIVENVVELYLITVRFFTVGLPRVRKEILGYSEESNWSMFTNIFLPILLTVVSMTLSSGLTLGNHHSRKVWKSFPLLEDLEGVGKAAVDTWRASLELQEGRSEENVERLFLQLPERRKSKSEPNVEIDVVVAKSGDDTSPVISGWALRIDACILLDKCWLRLTERAKCSLNPRTNFTSFYFLHRLLVENKVDPAQLLCFVCACVRLALNFSPTAGLVFREVLIRGLDVPGYCSVCVADPLDMTPIITHYEAQLVEMTDKNERPDNRSPLVHLNPDLKTNRVEHLDLLARYIDGGNDKGAIAVSKVVSKLSTMMHSPRLLYSGTQVLQSSLLCFCSCVRLVCKLMNYQVDVAYYETLGVSYEVVCSGSKHLWNVRNLLKKIQKNNRKQDLFEFTGITVDEKNDPVYLAEKNGNADRESKSDEIKSLLSLLEQR